MRELNAVHLNPETVSNIHPKVVQERLGHSKSILPVRIYREPRHSLASRDKLPLSYTRPSGGAGFTPKTLIENCS